MIKRLTCSTAIVVSLAITFILTASTVCADDLDNMVFEGTIRDSAGAVLPAARIAVVHLATGVERYAFSSDEGRYRISVNAPGSYVIKISAEGFKEEQSKEINV